MAITVKHKFVSAIPDAGDTTIVQPSNWNDSHDLVGTVPPANGGTGASTLTGYVKGNGTATMTASATVPSTDITGLGTMSTQNANAIAVTGGTMSGVSITGYIPTTEKAVANGVATLDGGGTVPVSQLPAAVLGALSYQGTWNASTNTPTLTSSVGTKGYYYVVNVAGSTNLNGITDWQIGDWAVYNGSAWQKIDNTDAVTSVNGYTGTVVLGYGDITTGVVPVVNGGTGVTVSSGANSVVLRDANVNINANALDDGYSNIAASGTPIVLTTASVRRFTITGSGGQTIKLPDATTLTSGAIFQFDNNQSSGAITVNNNSNTLIVSVPSGGFVLVNLLSNATAAGSWDRHDQAPSNVSWSTNTFDYAGSFTSGTWNGNAVAYNRGGTGQSSAFTAGGIVYGSTTSALAVTPIGTTGQVLTSAGAGTPTWTTPTTGTVTSVTGTSPVVSSGGTTPAISMAAANTTTNGYLTSTDWNTFNGKGSGSVTSVSLTAPSIFTVTGSPVTSSGTLALTYSGTALPILNGGTGQTTANAAFNALTPSQTSNSGKFLTTNGTDTSWASVTASSATNLAGGTTGAVPYQSGVATTAFLSGNTATTPNFYTSTGTGTLAQAPTLTTSTGTGSVVLGTRPTLAVTGTGLTLQDATDNTKTANFVLSGLTTATNYSYTLPAVTGSSLATLGNIAQTFTGATSFLPTTAASTLTIGGTAGTGTITLGQSTVNQSVGIADGTVASGSTSTVNIGVNGASGSTTNVNIGNLTNTSSFTANGAFSALYTTQGAQIGPSATTGAFVIGGTVQTASITIGRSTRTNNILIGNAATGSGYSQNVYIATSTAAGGTSSINIGSTTGTSTTTINGTLSLANALPVGSGGTGLTTTPANGALDIGNGTGFTRTTLTAGTGVSVTNASGSITFNATGTTINSQTSAYVLVAGDAGKTVSITTGGVTVNNSVMSAGNIVSIYNNSGSSQTITQGTGVTLQWAGQTASSTGNRTLGLYGLATIVYISASNAVITGSGLT